MNLDLSPIINKEKETFAWINGSFYDNKSLCFHGNHTSHSASRSCYRFGETLLFHLQVSQSKNKTLRWLIEKKSFDIRLEASSNVN